MYSLIKCGVLLLSLVLVASQTRIEDWETDSDAEIPRFSDDGTQEQETLDYTIQDSYNRDTQEILTRTSTNDINNDEVKSEASCTCRDRFDTALIKSLKSCTEALESCTDAVSATVGCGGGSVAGSSCAEIKRNCPRSTSGYYNLVINGRTVNSYCNMDRLCGSGGGWTRLGKLNMTNSSMSCPSGLQQHTVNGIRLCALRSGPACVSVRIPSNGLQYSQVCGRVRGYQSYTTNGFTHSGNINSYNYVDGVSITRGSPRKHVWSLAAGETEGLTTSNECPCNTGAPSSTRPPSFVGNDYYCESAVVTVRPANRFYTEDPLWDGRLCRSREAPCCRSSLLPWFNKNIGTNTTDFIELRVCISDRIGDENIGIDQYEFYVK